MAEMINEDVENNTDIDLIENWGRYKEVEIQILEVKCVLCDRIDAYKDIRDFYKAFFDVAPTHEQVMKYLEICKENAEVMLKFTQEMQLEMFQVDEWDDPYKALYKSASDCADEQDAFMALMNFNFVRPFAERLYNVFRQVHADMDGIKAESEESTEEE